MRFSLDRSAILVVAACGRFSAFHFVNNLKRKHSLGRANVSHTPKIYATDTFTFN